MKKTLKSIVLLGALCGGSLHASFEFRSPLFWQDRGYIHWLLAPAYDTLPSQKKNTDWNIHMWGAAYSRTANKAFYNSCHPDKITRDTAPLSQLFFGQSVFVGENIFVGGTFAGIPSAQQIEVNAVNPYLSFARIAPKFDYDEKGADMGIDFAKYVGRDDRYHIGGRANIPFKVINIRQDSDYTLAETLDDVFVTRIVNLDPTAPNGVTTGQVEYAMRFDFLSSLVFNTTSIPSGTPMATSVVQYVGSGSTATVTLVGTSLTGTSADQNINMPSAYATISPDGTVPTPPFRKNSTQVSGPLGADGANGVTGQAAVNSLCCPRECAVDRCAEDVVLFFQTGVDYAGNLQNDRAAQAAIFVTPRAIGGAGADRGDLTTDSTTILNSIQAIVNADLAVSEPVTTFFLNNGIDLGASERIVGLGDFSTEVYGGVGHYDDWFVDGIFGLQFPTGKRQKNADRVYYKPTGNNGHVEVKLEIDGGWKPRPWFAFEIRPTYVHACKRSEKRAASFEGATVVNIGPEIEVDVSWNYFVLQTDFSFFHPHNPDLGFTLGYELFAKGHDHVSSDCQTTATDLLCNTNQPLAICNYEKHTNSFSNKLRGEVFHRWNYFEIFGGGSQMLSGRNIMKETEAHLGLAIYF